LLGIRMNKNFNFDKNKLYSLEYALNFFINNKFAKFDESLDISINLDLDVRKSDQQVRGITSLPFGLGKKTVVAVFAKGDKADLAKKSGADFVGADDLFDKVAGGFTSFDRCISTPDMMPIVSRLGKILGPKSLMPNPKLGTVTSNVEDAVKSAKIGQIEYRADKFGIVHATVGKVSFASEKLLKNIKYFFQVISTAKPSGVKGTYIKSVFLSSTMGPGVKILVSDLL
jgi:large subunit ribosomal protein L1